MAVSDLDCINAEPGIGIDEKFDRMISTRLKKIEPCTWRDLYDALNHPTVAMSDVASKISVKLPPGRCNGLCLSIAILCINVLLSSSTT